MGPETQPAHDDPGDGHRGHAVSTDEVDSNSEPWYAARCVFRWRGKTPEAPGYFVYEERIVLFRADSFKEAHSKADDEAQQYAADNDADFIDFVEVFHLFENKITDGSELFSFIRESPLPPEEYVERFIDNGKEGRGAP